MPLLRLHLREHGLPEPVREFRFHPIRRWRLDYFWSAAPGGPVALEIEGGVHIGGRHVRGVGSERDMEKYAEALCAGIRVLRVTPAQLKSGQAALWLDRLLRPRIGLAAPPAAP